MGVALACQLYHGLLKLPASPSKQMEQKTPVTFSHCAVVPVHVEATYIDDVVIGVR